jgi:hypothetical protein
MRGVIRAITLLSIMAKGSCSLAGLLKCVQAFQSRPQRHTEVEAGEARQSLKGSNFGSL